MLETVLMMDPAIVLSFMGAGILLNITPGSDVLFAMASGLSGGRRVAAAASLGIALGSVLHVTLAVLGLAAAIAAVPGAYDAIRYLGAAYLIWLAINAWTKSSDIQARSGARRWSQAVRVGFWTNALNPKVALFMLAFLPQFAQPQIGPVAYQFAVLGMIFVVTGFVVNLCYGTAAGFLGDKLRQASGLLGKITALVFGGLALRLVMD